MANSRKSFDLSQLRVGIFVLFGLAILAFLILNSTGDFNPFQKKLRLKTRFAAADGLRSGSEVQLAGVRIGKVDVVQLMPPESVEEETIEAVLLVDQEVDGQPVTERIRSDSTAQLVSVSLLATEKLINITPGTAAGTPVAENVVLESSTSSSINDLTKEGNELVKQINQITVPANDILIKANRGEGTLGRIVNDDSLYRNLDTTIAEAKLTVKKLQLTLDKANNGDGTAGRLLNDPALYENLNNTVSRIELITREIRSGKGTIGKIVNDDALYLETRSAISELRLAVGKVNLILDDVSAGKGTVGKLFKEDQLYSDASVTLERFNKAATRIESLIADAQAGKGTLGKLVTDDSLFNNVSSTSSSINKFSDEATKLLYDFRQNPKKFLRIKLALF